MRSYQARAAELLRRGFTQREAAVAVGRSERTIRSWLSEVDGFREAATPWPEREGVSPRETLEAALEAVKPNGSPDWRIRVDAAKALLANSDGPAPVVSVPPGGLLTFPDAIAEVLEG